MTTPTRAAQLDHVVSQLFVAVESMRVFYEQCASELELTPPQARMLMLVGQPCSQRDLAEQFSCDASNIVGIVDRLEQRGLVARQAPPTDRRVKQVVLTDAGRHLREQFESRLQSHAPVLSDLNDDELQQFGRLLDRFAIDG